MTLENICSIFIIIGVSGKSSKSCKYRCLDVKKERNRQGFNLNKRSFAFQNITISGVAGTGSTTLLNRLKEELLPYGWRGYSGGEYMRRFLSDTNGQAGSHHNASDYGEDVDRKMDENIRQELSSGHGMIIESWLSGFLAQGVPGVLKILLTCSNDLDRARRLAERDSDGIQINLENAMLDAFRRLATNNERWTQMYADEWENWIIKPGILPAKGQIFFWHPRLYDLVLDTAVFSAADCTMLTLNVLRDSMGALREI
jgi:cytidylate kinase